MTAVASSRSNPLMWAGLLAVAALVVLLSFTSDDDAAIGGRADPNGTGREGLRALRLLVEESGGTTQSLSVPDDDIEAALLATRAYDDVLAELNDEPGQTEANYAPLLAWVDRGGVLVTGVDVPGGPTMTGDLTDDEDAIRRGQCDIDQLDGVMSLRAELWTPIAIAPADRSCFGDGETAFVVRRPRGDGAVVRVGSLDVFFNRFLDDADNAALAARLFGLGDGASLAFLTGPETGPLFGDGPVNEDGEPVGAGESTLLDLLHPGVIPMFVGLAGAAVLFALARGRRLGSPVEETVPIELPSSGHVEAVGRLYAKVEEPRARTAERLREDFRSGASRRFGLPPDAPLDDLVPLIEPDRDRRPQTRERLTDAPLENDEALIELARDLNERRRALAGRDVTDQIATQESTT